MLVDICDTEYMIMASDDDIYDPIFLEEIDALTNKYVNVDLFRGRVKVINTANEIFEKDILLDEYQSQIEFPHSFFCQNLIQCVGHYVFRTAKIREKKAFMNLPLAWDSDQAAAIMTSDKGVCNTPSIVFSFRHSKIQISSQENHSIHQEKTKAHYLFMIFFGTNNSKSVINIRERL